jgi:aryl-alcohol dehydrogenase-like predicted oxidoreductase
MKQWRRQLGQSAVSLSPLSLGTVKFGRNQSVKYPSSFDLPDDKSLQLLLACALEQGISSLDTAPAYGIAEQRLGLLLKGRRQQYEIISKAGERYDNEKDSSLYDYSAKALRQQLEQSLRLLKTDYLDCWLLHSNGEDSQNLNDEVLHCLQQAKQQGLVRSIGASTKTVAGGEIALRELDCCMIAASLHYHDEDSLFTVAKTQNKGLLLKKNFDSGWALSQQADTKQQALLDTYQHLFNFEATTSAVIGTINPMHLQQNVEAFMQATQHD